MSLVWTALLVLLYPAVTASIWVGRFARAHLIHSSKLSRYKSSGSWALVTGASDGIGFGFVEELASKGFNVILHGRNRPKLEGLVEKLQKDYPVKFRIFVLDASDREEWNRSFTQLAAELKSVNFRILVNNIGGTGGFKAFEKTGDLDFDAVNRTIDMNAGFPAALTNAMFPVLQQPSLIINIGSIVAFLPPPWLALYAGSKAFNLAFNQSLWTEMLADKKDVEVLGIVVGRVINATRKERIKASIFEPSARDFAKAAFGKVGCGLSQVAPYWPHDLQISVLNMLPAWATRGVLITESKKEMEDERLN